MKVQAWGEVVNGRFVMQDEALYRSDMKRLPDGPARAVVYTEDHRDDFRQMQRWWHGCAVELCRQHFGLQHDQMHYALLGEFGGHMDGPLGRPVPIVASSSKLSRQQWVSLIDWVLIWGPSEHGIDIPEPNSHLAKTLTQAYHQAGEAA